MSRFLSIPLFYIYLTLSLLLHLALSFLPLLFLFYLLHLCFSLIFVHLFLNLPFLFFLCFLPFSFSPLFYLFPLCSFYFFFPWIPYLFPCVICFVLLLLLLKWNLVKCETVNHFPWMTLDCKQNSIQVLKLFGEKW